MINSCSIDEINVAIDVLDALANNNVFENEEIITDSVYDEIDRVIGLLTDWESLIENKSTETNNLNKPPLGLKPRWLHDKNRMYEILDAIMRYSQENVSAPTEWVTELQELIWRNFN